jgi:hypothetical protein
MSWADPVAIAIREKLADRSELVDPAELAEIRLEVERELAEQRLADWREKKRWVLELAQLRRPRSSMNAAQKSAVIEILGARTYAKWPLR